MSNSLLAIEPKNKYTISKDVIRDQLSRILENSTFVRSKQFGQFLRFTVETTLESKTETLKAYIAGNHVYGWRSGKQIGELQSQLGRKETHK